MSLITPGALAPRFKLPSSTGKTIDLSALRGRIVVLYFYPRADSPGCTKQACGFRDARAEYDQSKIAVLGISPDTVEDVTKFAKKLRLHFPLLADPNHAVAEQYGAWQERSMYGNKYMGIARTTFVIGKDGRVKHVFQNVRPKGHEQRVLQWIAGDK